MAAQNGLTGQRWNVSLRLTKLLKLAGAHPVHAKRPGQVVRDVAAVSAFAEAICLLKQDHISRERAKRIGDLLEVPAELDIPADNRQLALVVSGCVICCRANDAVNSAELAADHRARRNP